MYIHIHTYLHINVCFPCFSSLVTGAHNSIRYSRMQPDTKTYTLRVICTHCSHVKDEGSCSQKGLIHMRKTKGRVHEKVLLTCDRREG